jgi:hypothetical protein
MFRSVQYFNDQFQPAKTSPHLMNTVTPIFKNFMLTMSYQSNAAGRKPTCTDNQSHKVNVNVEKLPENNTKANKAIPEPDHPKLSYGKTLKPIGVGKSKI